MSETGMPLLSGPPPPIENPRSISIACRKCNKEFNVLFTRSRKCQHCGFSYCPACSDFQALMPRSGLVRETGRLGAGAQGGYDVVNVCAFCIENLQITACGKNCLKSLPLAKLRKYAGAYNIAIDHAVEKDDVIEAIMNAKGPNGCLSPDNERFYRKYSVPDRTAGGAARPRGIFSRSGQNASASVRTNDNLPPRPPQHTRPEFARPDLEPDQPNPPPPQQQQQQHSQQQQQHSQHEYHYHDNFHQPHQPPPQPPPPNRPQFNSYNSDPHPHYQPHYHTPPPPPPPPPLPPPHQEYHWGRPPYAHNSFYSTWGYPAEPDYYNYGAQSTYHHAHGHSHPNYTSCPLPSGPPPPPTNTRPGPPPPQFHTHPHTTPLPPPPPPPPPHRPSQPQQSQHRPSSPPRPQEAQPAPNSPPRSQTQPTPTSTPSRPPTQTSSSSPSSPPQAALNSPPNLDDLLDMSPTSIRGLSISNLKSVLFANHVNVNATMVLEKSDLVSRVMQLVEDEKRERERARVANEEEEARLMQMIREQKERERMEAEQRKRDKSVENESMEAINEKQISLPSMDPPQASTSASPPASKKSFSEKSGLCVICQDEESNIAIVDCGHLAMCRTCSDLIMSTTRECPLCRTRIVTEARLLRIFKS